MAESGHDDLKLASEYAWNWFSLHAGQRMQVVSFFILASSFLTTAYVAAMQKNLFIVAGFIAIGGAATSLSVLGFEGRTHDLLDVGRKALATIEEVISSRCEIDLVKLVANTPGPRLAAPKYRRVIGALTLVASALFALGATYSFACYFA